MNEIPYLGEYGFVECKVSPTPGKGIGSQLTIAFIIFIILFLILHDVILILFPKF